MTIQNRKKEHVELTVHEDVFYEQKTGFDLYRFVHNALPEVNFDNVDVTATLLGRTFSLPLFISSMTGGYSKGKAVNAQLAEFCAKYNLPLGVGSQRSMLENPNETDTFSVVRKHAPDAFIAANIGGAQLVQPVGSETLNRLVDSIEANAIIIHLNPLQELMQPEGDRKFAGIAKGIDWVKRNSGVPIIVKETGAGISGQVAKRLLEIGVDAIDTAGAGGTSWAKVENLRKRTDEPLTGFNDWGIPTVECILEIAELKSRYRFELIASGGIKSSFDMMKAIALGADFAACAQPIIKTMVKGGAEELDTLYRRWHKECKIILTLLGCKNIGNLNRSHLTSRTL